MDEFRHIVGLLFGWLGLISNGILLIVLCRTRVGWHRLNLQMVWPLAVLDFAGSLLVVVRNVLYLILGNLSAGVWFCTYFGTPIIVLMPSSIIIVGVMAVDRYHIVVWRRGISCVWGWGFVIISGMFLVTLVVVNTAMYGLHPSSTFAACRFVKNTITFMIFTHLTTLILLTGLLTVTLCYMGIYRHCHRTLAAFHTMPKRFLYILAAYLLCWLPTLICIVWELIAGQKAIPKFLKLSSSFGLLLHLLVNPCLIILFQASLRNEVYYLFTRNPTPSLNLNKHVFP
ncbi:hypothetical protein DSO57_1035813 [Entomophthora muscae]|uniref:Uncharacterized protein n=1 Tax=Entomophthora muscae TaxID=34485 RepID=A0ACC2UK72_9FUNG|nr:hypothetical protein DSO57_1035813 [Entomophthora muscae]